MAGETPGRPENEFDPSTPEIDRYLTQLEGSGQLESAIRQRKVETAASRSYYEKARKRAEAILASIDSEMVVTVEQGDGVAL